jgi:hypothetical protein
LEDMDDSSDEEVVKPVLGKRGRSGKEVSVKYEYEFENEDNNRKNKGEKITNKRR